MESKFKHADVEIMKIENSKEIGGLGPNLKDCFNVSNIIEHVKLDP